MICVLKLNIIILPIYGMSSSKVQECSLSLLYKTQHVIFLRAEKMNSVVVQLFEMFQNHCMNILSVVWLSASKDAAVRHT